jgi:hypothetical protein
MKVLIRSEAVRKSVREARPCETTLTPELALAPSAGWLFGGVRRRFRRSGTDVVGAPARVFDDVVEPGAPAKQFNQSIANQRGEGA